MDSAAMDSAAMDREAFVDLGAVTANVAALCELVGGSQVLAAVKADGYGHGMVPAARAALAGGAAWLGVADLDEAVALRRAGITAPVLCMMAFGDPAEAVRHDIDLAAGSADSVAKVEAAAVRVGVRARARLHLKADTGLARGGATPADWPGVVAAALDAQARGSVRVVGLWSHFACADIPGHPSIAAQLTAFADAVAVAEKAGVTPEVRHIANTAGALTVPRARLDLVRLGGAIYGLSTLPGGAPGWLRPAMTLKTRLAQVKRVPPGEARQLAEAVLRKVGLAEKIDAYPDQLSGGQQQRVAIARSLAMSPQVMLFDEITSALDPELVGEVLKVLEEMARDGMTMMLVTHEIGFARKVADRVVFMHEGRIWEEGPAAATLAQPRTPELETFLSAVLH